MRYRHGGSHDDAANRYWRDGKDALLARLARPRQGRAGGTWTCQRGATRLLAEDDEADITRVEFDPKHARRWQRSAIRGRVSWDASIRRSAEELAALARYGDRRHRIRQQQRRTGGSAGSTSSATPRAANTRWCDRERRDGGAPDAAAPRRSTDVPLRSMQSGMYSVARRATFNGYLTLPDGGRRRQAAAGAGDPRRAVSARTTGALIADPSMARQPRLRGA